MFHKMIINVPVFPSPEKMLKSAELTNQNFIITYPNGNIFYTAKLIGLL